MNEKTSENKEDKIKYQALIDNTAQGIFNYLKEIENKREIYEKRWIWELLQNALDATPQDRKIEIKIIRNNNKLTFAHNGRPFKPEEVAHLIYHGSTKREDDIGKFGTGFLVTHLLSKKVNVKGVRDDSKNFDFELDRNASSADDIKKLMEETWERYQNSLHLTYQSSSYTAEYEYSLNDISEKSAKEGIEALGKIAPYVLAFNDKLGTVEVIDQNCVLKFKLVRESSNSSYITKIVKEIKQEKGGEVSEEHELWIATSDEIEIAVKAKKQDDENYQIENLHDIPKIFTSFPLFGTEDMPFPVVVNSRKFEPTEKRDGIFIGKEDTPDIKRNKNILENAGNLFIKMIKKTDFNRWENVHILLNLTPPPVKDWLDKDWFINLLKNLINEVMNVKVFKTADGNFISPKECLVPIIGDFEGGKGGRFWNLCYQFTPYKDKIPANTLASEWARIFQNWKLLGIFLAEKEITIEKLAAEIAKCKNLQNFKSNLTNSIDELNFLNAFYELLLGAEKRSLLDNICILPDQNGNLKKKPELFKDEGIDEILKDISAKLGTEINIRNQLLRSAISEDIKNLLPVKKEVEVLNHVISIIKQPRLGDVQYLQANIYLFNWILEHNKSEYFEGYSVLSLKENTFTQLSKQSKEKLLAPKEIWNEKARIYAELFPQDFIISSVYFEKISQKDEWNKLKDFILIDPLYIESEKINQNYLETLLLSSEKLDEEKEHEIADSIEVSKISFLETKDRGIIDTVGKSKEKARKFLEFLFKYIIEEDNQWNIPTEVTCNCGTKHKIYPSMWLAQLRNRQWVPIRKNKDEKPTAQNLALLLEDNKDLLQNCRQDKPSQLLRNLNVSIGELMMNVVAKNESIKLELDNAMGSLYSTFMTNPTQLTKIAELAESEPDLFVKEIEEKIQRREQIRRNQQVGSLVETFLKNVLEKEGFKVERTGTGSDYAVEYDFIKDNEEQIFKIEKEEKIYFYLEVKSTNQEFVRMTFTQAKQARDNSNEYVLCFVKLDGLEITEENVKNNARFIMDIGQMIRDKVSKAETFKHEQETVVESGDIEIEISEGPIRFKIYKRIWENGKAFEQFLESI